MPGQLSLFSADAQPTSYDDLEGLLAGPGQLVRREQSVRLSIVLPRSGGWRGAALLAGLAALGLDGEELRREPAGGTVVRTGFCRELLPLATRWTRGSLLRPPAGFALDGPRLRWWCAAAGWSDGVGWSLRLGSATDAGWLTVGAALSAAGVSGTFVGPRAGGPAFRIVGARRIGRLRELVGDRPPGTPAAEWPAEQPAPGRQLAQLRATARVITPTTSAGK